MYTILDLFAGIGGFSLAARWAGMETKAFCERDPYCKRVLRKNFGEDIIIDDDIRTMDGKPYRGAVDIVCGGFPCQPFSVAGRRTGTSDERYLWPDMLRVINECRPRYVLGENVTHLDGMGLASIASDLEASGYGVTVFDIPACSVELPTMERHLWIVAASNRERPQGGKRVALPWQCQVPREFSRDNTREFERWAVPASRVCGVAERIPDRVDRIKALGNAIVPQVAYVILCAIRDMDAKENANVTL